MKETFKKTFGFVIGIYAACVAIEILGECKKTYLKVTRKPAEENTEETEESI